MIVGNGIANGLFIIASNRWGYEGKVRFYGSSFISNPYGRILVQARRGQSAILVADLDLDQRPDWLELFLLLATRAAGGLWPAHHRGGMTWLMPAETAPQDRNWTAFPPAGYTVGTTAADAIEARRLWSAVAHAAEFEPATVVVDPADTIIACNYLGTGVEMVQAPLNDAWMRDIGPTFVKNDDGGLGGAELARTIGASNIIWLPRGLTRARDSDGNSWRIIEVPALQTLRDNDGWRCRCLRKTDPVVPVNCDPSGVGLRMVIMEVWVEIRRLHRSGHLGIKTITRGLGLARNTVKAALAADAPPRYERPGRGSLTDAVEPQIRALLKGFPPMPATVIAERIGPDGSIPRRFCGQR